MKKNIYVTPRIDMVELAGEIVMQNVSVSGGDSGLGNGGSSTTLKGDGDIYGETNSNGSWDIW